MVHVFQGGCCRFNVPSERSTASQRKPTGINRTRDIAKEKIFEESSQHI